jgi:hypothetical protein
LSSAFEGYQGERWISIDINIVFAVCYPHYSQFLVWQRFRLRQTTVGQFLFICEGTGDTHQAQAQGETTLVCAMLLLHQCALN